jgi:addiction module HigA family antidote
MSITERKMERLRSQTRRPSTPGEVLREITLPALGISQGEFAARLGVGRKTISEVLTGKRPVSPDLAHRLGRLLGNGPGLWLKMQSSVDMWDALHMDARKYQHIEPIRIEPIQKAA